MNTTKDFLAGLLRFAAFLGAGFLIFELCGCYMTPHEAQQVKDAGHLLGGLLPPPLGGIADSLATVIGTFGVYKGVKHVHKRMKASKAKQDVPVAPAVH